MAHDFLVILAIILALVWLFHFLNIIFDKFSVFVVFQYLAWKSAVHVDSVTGHLGRRVKNP